MVQGGYGSSDQEAPTEAIEQRTIPVYKATRDRIRELKGDKSYDEIISELADRYEESE